MRAIVILSRKQMVQLYCHLRSCERAAFALEPDLLPEFVGYHDEEKALKITSFIADIRRWADTSRSHPLFSTVPLRRFVSMFSPVPFGVYYFEPGLLLRSGDALELFINLKDGPYRSDQKACLQKELAFLRGKIERQSGILHWHPAANDVDHFYRTPTLPAFAIEELIETKSSVLYDRWNGSHEKRAEHLMRPVPRAMRRKR